GGRRTARPNLASGAASARRVHFPLMASTFTFCDNSRKSPARVPAARQSPGEARPEAAKGAGMTTTPTPTPLSPVRFAGLEGDDGLTDGQLLARFVETHDEAALAALVRRLGPSVLGVCRRVIGDAHLAEDAFQATFLVLVRRAAVIHPREQVGSWLYG